MANQITGKVIAVSGEMNVASKKPMQMKQLWIDCTRFDPYTGERSKYENKPMFDFKGESMKLLDGIKKDDVVTVSFDINGYQYQDEQGKTKVFTSIRPYALTKRESKQQEVAAVNDDMPF